MAASQCAQLEALQGLELETPVWDAGYPSARTTGPHAHSGSGFGLWLPTVSLLFFEESVPLSKISCQYFCESNSGLHSIYIYSHITVT